jgi:phosphate starvation-inducible PhoH-like protein
MKNKKQDKSPIVIQSPKLKHHLTIRERDDLTEKQKEFLKLALDKNVKLMFISGPAGTSKTYMAVYAALKLLADKRASDLIYVRSAVESSDSKLGFLPGEKADKLEPYIVPLFDKLDELLSRNEIDGLMKEKKINSIHVGFLRGLDWKVKVVIADEAQNMTEKEIVTLITRPALFTKIFVLGDPTQSDINSKSGFTKIFTTFNDDESKKNGIYTFQFDEEDVVRSPLVQFIIKKIKKGV